MSTEASVKGGGAGAAIGPPLFGRIEGAAPHYYLQYFLPPHFKKLLTPLHEPFDCHLPGQNGIWMKCVLKEIHKLILEIGKYLRFLPLKKGRNLSFG